ncbi:M28 family metallopeptidase [Pendulispora albinea]|uniref:M28 family peptidase n=1 Tax=Pendulispora albinea TaxID=2741071 RepID=A0ABZ2LVD2_9BACT
MRTRGVVVTSLTVLALWACSDANSRDVTALAPSELANNNNANGARTGSTLTAEALADDTDPMVHLEYLASDALRGRNAPSADFDKAATYVTDFVKKYGLVGPNPGDSNGPYAQSFQQGALAADLTPEGQRAAHVHSLDTRDPSSYGSSQFEHGFYIDPKSSSPEASALAQRSDAVLAGNTHNVLATLEGTGPKKNEVIVAMAHLDHLGVGSGGAVYNGADDNGSGSSVLLSLVPLLAQAKANGELNRSILFFWTSAEEDGLVGSKYFVDHPIAGIGLSQIVGVVNMDMVGRWDDQRISVIDTKSDGTTSYLSALLTQANNALPDPFDRINHDIAAYARRQDGASFYDKNEDVLFVFEGLSNPAGGGNLHSDYHQPTDDVSKIVAENGGRKVRRVRDLLNSTLKLAANADIGGGPTCTGTSYKGTLTGTGTQAFQPSDSGYDSTVSGTHGAKLVGPGGTDFDLFLQKWNGTSWAQVSKSDGSTSNESVSYPGTAGKYRWRVYSYSGSGEYSLCTQKP